jgi:hypothetical protein
MAPDESSFVSIFSSVDDAGDTVEGFSKGEG